jgi:arginine decarboxylase-like protein
MSVVREAKSDGTAVWRICKEKPSQLKTLFLGGTIIVKAGETVGREHSVLVQEVTSERLNEVQKESEEDHQSEVASLQKEIEELRSPKQTPWVSDLRDELAQKLISTAAAGPGQS